MNRLLFAEWLPQIMYNQHQGTYPPRIFVPPFPDPVNPNIDPQIVRGVDLVGGAMQDRFEREGKNGVISRYAFSIWYNGSVRTTSYFHNIIGILTETGHVSATPFTYEASRFPPTLSNGVATLVPSVTYPNPWKGGTLHLRDAVEYMLTGSMAVLEVAAKYRERFLYGIYQVGARQIAKGQTEAPVAYVVPTLQHDGPASLAFIGTLMKGGIEVHRASRPFAADGISYPEGTYVVLLAQPFRPFAKDLLERQPTRICARMPTARRCRPMTSQDGRSRIRWASTPLRWPGRSTPRTSCSWTRRPRPAVNSLRRLARMCGAMLSIPRRMLRPSR